MLTAADLAARWGCSSRTVNRMAQLRVLPALKRGRHWRFSPDAVSAYEIGHTNAAPAQPALTAAPQPVLSAVPNDFEGELPPRWWEQDTAASPAAGRTRSAGTRKAASVSS